MDPRAGDWLICNDGRPCRETGETLIPGRRYKVRSIVRLTDPPEIRVQLEGVERARHPLGYEHAWELERFRLGPG